MAVMEDKVQKYEKVRAFSKEAGVRLAKKGLISNKTIGQVSGVVAGEKGARLKRKVFL